MTPETVQAILSTALFVAAGLVGVRSSRRLHKRYKRSRDLIDPRFRPLFLMVVIACYLITLAALWIGSLSAVRLIFDTVFTWSPPITLTIATVVIFIPAMFEYTIEVIAPSNDPSTLYKIMRRFRPESDSPNTARPPLINDPADIKEETN